jgi:transketolase
LEQIKNDICYSDLRVTLVGISAGVSYGALGSTHHSLHDLAALRAINNLDIVVPADNFETRECIRAAVNHARPLYVRFGKRPLPTIYDVNEKFKIGQASIIRDGHDVAVMAIGETVHPALSAAQKLEHDGFSVQVVSVHTLSPLDQATILESAQRCKVMLTVEEHMQSGGLGEAIAALLMRGGISLPFEIVGIPNEYTVTGSQMDIFNHYGISASGLSQIAKKLLTQVQRNKQ